MSAANPTASTTDDTTSQRADKKPVKQEGIRETVEAVAIAFILAFVFKTFEAEAFVIPTGSMAPTLFGRHKEVNCPKCNFFYTVGASQEIDQESGILNPAARVRSIDCPNCGKENDITSSPVFNGDRIVVNKEVSRYRRFDVVVFKNPEEPRINYIKRLVGMPGETVRIRQGDVQSRQSDADQWVTQRKEDPNVQRDIQLIVYDDRHPATELLKAGAEERWTPATFVPEMEEMGGWNRAINGWTADPETRTYTVKAADGSPEWLRYRHLAPSSVHWNSASQGAISPKLTAKLIGDYCGFNAKSNYNDDNGAYWVKDLTLDANVNLNDVTEASRLIFEITQGVRSLRCEIQPANGKVELQQIAHTGSNPGEKISLCSAECSIKGAGEYSVTMACVDDRICLWIDDELVPLGDGAILDTPAINLPTYRDMAPIGIAAQSMSGAVSNLVVKRDIYYRNDLLSYQPVEGALLYRDNIQETAPGGDLESALRDPAQYAMLYSRLVGEQESRYGDLLHFPLADDEYLMFGDNSPASQDSRLFYFEGRMIRGPEGHRYAVKEKNLIGQALCIFWPHGIPFMNDGKGYTMLGHNRYSDGRVVRDKSYPLYSVPFYPNLSRMKRIR